MKFFTVTIFAVLFFIHSYAQSDTLILKDIDRDQTSPAKQVELKIPSAGSLLQGFIYEANGPQKHPLLLLLHGYPGNERNLDLAQVARARGWNVLYFDYRGSWGSQGNFSFENCVQDVANVVSFCKQYSDSLKIDTSNIVLLGHSMGGWVCLKALQRLPNVKKGFALSTWDIYGDTKQIKSEQELVKQAKENGGDYFVLNTPIAEIFKPVWNNKQFYNLANDGKALANKQIIMLDEHNANKELAAALKTENKNYFDYQVWETDHPFTNKRVALIKLVLGFLNK